MLNLPDNAFSDGSSDDGWRKHRTNPHPDLHFEIGAASSARPVLCGIRPALGHIPLNRSSGGRTDPDIVWRRSDFLRSCRVFAGSMLMPDVHNRKARTQGYKKNEWLNEKNS